MNLRSSRLALLLWSPGLLIIIFALYYFLYIFFTRNSPHTSDVVLRESDFAIQNPPIFDTTLYPQLKPLLSLAAYPVYASLLSVLTQWNPDNPTPPPSFTETLQHFNYSDPAERALAEVYREAELPFKMFDVPIFNKISQKWTKEYLSHNFKHTK